MLQQKFHTYFCEAETVMPGHPLNTIACELLKSATGATYLLATFLRVDRK